MRSLFAAGLTIDATWPIEMEMKNRMRGLNSAALETAITVVCRPRVAGPPAEFRDVRDEIRRVVQQSVRRFWSYGFRGADLIVACYGPAVGAFGRHERVEKADGAPVEIPELLDLARRAARDAIAGQSPSTTSGPRCTGPPSRPGTTPAWWPRSAAQRVPWRRHASTASSWWTGPAAGWRCWRTGPTAVAWVSRRTLR